MRGRFRNRVGLYTPSAQTDDIGGVENHWTFARAYWADIEVTGLSERLVDGRRVPRQRFKVTLRYQPGFPRQARLMWRGQVLRVLASSDPDAKGERLHLICEADA